MAVEPDLPAPLPALFLVFFLVLFFGVLLVVLLGVLLEVLPRAVLPEALAERPRLGVARAVVLLVLLVRGPGGEDVRVAMGAT